MEKTNNLFENTEKTIARIKNDNDTRYDDVKEKLTDGELLDLLYEILYLGEALIKALVENK